MNQPKVKIEISIPAQTLLLTGPGERVRQYLVSTAKNGAGEIMDSECTPRGLHLIGDKIGADATVNSVFVGRVPTGEIYTTSLRAGFPERDWILTRILWLSGCEQGFNLGGNVDTHARYIYIHGAPDDVVMGEPGSRGCIRMRNRDVMEVYEQVQIGTEVLIV